MLFFFKWKGIKGKKGTFTRYVGFLKISNVNFLIEFVYIRQKKRLEYIGLLLSVRSFVRPVVTLFRLSDTLLNFARTGVFISEL